MVQRTNNEVCVPYGYCFMANPFYASPFPHPDSSWFSYKPQTLGAHHFGAHPLYDFNNKLQW
jgi:hypothetical protein